MKQVLSFILTGFLAMSCASPPAGVRSGSNLVSRTTEPYQMAPLDRALVTLPGGDVETVDVLGDGTTFIGNESRRVEGMGDAEFRALVRGDFPNAIDIQIVEFRPNKVSVLGEVYHQLHAELTDGPMRLMDALAGANGFTALANKRRVRLIRQNGGVIEVYEFDLRESLRGNDMEQNILLEPGDVITVPRNFL